MGDDARATSGGRAEDFDAGGRSRSDGRHGHRGRDRAGDKPITPAPAILVAACPPPLDNPMEPPPTGSGPVRKVL